MKANLGALVAGTICGAGLALAQMTNPAKVIAFLDIAGAWDPSLAFVMGGAMLVAAIAFRIFRDRLPAIAPGTGVDVRLLAGAALFGLGWGLAGLCPGAAVAALVTGSGKLALFVVSMMAGMGLFHLTEARRPRASNRVASDHAA